VVGPHPTVGQGVVCPVHLREVSPPCGHLPERPPSSPSVSAASLPSLSWSDPQLGEGALLTRHEPCPQSHGSVTAFRIQPNASAHSALAHNQAVLG